MRKSIIQLQSVALTSPISFIGEKQHSDAGALFLVLPEPAGGEAVGPDGGGAGRCLTV